MIIMEGFRYRRGLSTCCIKSSLETTKFIQILSLATQLVCLSVKQFANQNQSVRQLVGQPVSAVNKIELICISVFYFSSIVWNTHFHICLHEKNCRTRSSTYPDH